MPYPLHDHVADSYLSLIQSSRILSQTEETRIRTYIKNLPARITIDLLSQAGHDINTWIYIDDGMDADAELAHLDSPNRDLFFVILNRIRMSIGLYSWVSTPSYLMDDVSDLLHRMYDFKVNNGMLPDERTRLYELTTALTDGYLNPDDDDDDDDNDNDDYNDNDDDTASVHSDASTAVTEPLEQTLGELMDVLDRANDNTYAMMPPLEIYT
jgi:hypothetical protein